VASSRTPSSGEGEGDLRYENMPLADEPGFRLGIAGSYRALIEMSGARPVDDVVHKRKPAEARIH